MDSCALLKSLCPRAFLHLLKNVRNLNIFSVNLYLNLILFRSKIKAVIVHNNVTMSFVVDKNEYIQA